MDTDDVAQLEVDDRHNYISRSGLWSQESKSVAHDKTISSTSTTGASMTIRFYGTSITVKGGFVPLEGTTISPLMLQFTLNGAPNPVWVANSSSDYMIDTYYNSTTLPIGEHTLQLTNMMALDAVHIDSFIIRAIGGQPPRILPPAPSNSYTSSRSQTPSRTQSQRPVTTTASVTVAAASSEVITTQKTIHSSELDLTSTDPISSTQPSATNQDLNVATGQSEGPGRFIAAVAVGIIIVLLLVAIVILLTRRRHNRQALRKFKISHPYTQSILPSMNPSYKSGTLPEKSFISASRRSSIETKGVGTRYITSGSDFELAKYGGTEASQPYHYGSAHNLEGNNIRNTKTTESGSLSFYSWS